MTLPVEKKFLIHSCAGSKPWASANNRDHCAVKPVILNGEMKTWSGGKAVHRVPGLVLDDVWYSTREGDRVVVQLNPPDPPTVWMGKDFPDGSMAIELAGTGLVWTLIEVEPKRVVLEPFVPGNPYQLWRLEFL